MLSFGYLQYINFSQVSYSFLILVIHFPYTIDSIIWNCPLFYQFIYYNINVLIHREAYCQIKNSHSLNLINQSKVLLHTDTRIDIKGVYTLRGKKTLFYKFF